VSSKVKQDFFNLAPSSGAIYTSTGALESAIVYRLPVKISWHFIYWKWGYCVLSVSMFLSSVLKWASNKEPTLNFVLKLVKLLPIRFNWWNKFMAMIAYSVAECTSGFNVFKVHDQHKWRWTCGPTKIRDHRKFHRNCAWIHKKSAEIIIEIRGNRIEHLQNLDLSHFDRIFGLTKGVCTVCSAQIDWRPKIAQNSTFEGHH